MNDDEINAPSHYTTLRDALGIDVIDLIEAMDFGYHLGNVIKYVFRHEYKGEPLKDLHKAAWYLNRYIAEVEEEEREANSLTWVNFRTSPPLVIDDAAAYVSTSPERVAGNDERAERIKREYYGHNPHVIVGYCANCDLELGITIPVVTSEAFEDDVKFCSTSCINKLIAWQRENLP